MRAASGDALRKRKNSRFCARRKRRCEGPLELLEHRQREWLSLWELCQSQRYGQGMTMGTLVHSEIWNNLEKLQYEGHEKRRAFRLILGIDEIFRGHARKMEERRGDGK